jgi:hypothetical protein
MIHPVLRILAEQPMLVAAHLGAYADLASDELLLSGRVLKQRWMWQLVGLLCFVVTAVLAGVALLLWASLPLLFERTFWVFIATPLVPMVFGLWAWRMARSRRHFEPFARLQLQLREDSALLGQPRT